MTRHKAVARRRTAVAAGACLVALLGLSTATAAYRLGNGTTASAGGSVANSCYSLFSTIGEATAGTVGNGTYRLTSGFSALHKESLASDRIFKNGFDGPKDCTP